MSIWICRQGKKKVKVTTEGLPRDTDITSLELVKKE